jgi:hypothetical protein
MVSVWFAENALVAKELPLKPAGFFCGRRRQMWPGCFIDRIRFISRLFSV